MMVWNWKLDEKFWELKPQKTIVKNWKERTVTESFEDVSTFAKDLSAHFCESALRLVCQWPIFSISRKPCVFYVVRG